MLFASFQKTDNAYHHPPAEAKAELKNPGSGRVDDVGWHGASLNKSDTNNMPTKGSLILKQVANFRTKVNIQ